jgi:hypothetical protein
MEDKRQGRPERIQVQPGAVRRILGMLGAGLAVAIISILLHNAIYSFFRIDEPFFLTLGFFVGPLLMVVGVVAFIMYAVNRALG